MIVDKAKESLIGFAPCMKDHFSHYRKNWVHYMELRFVMSYDMCQYRGGRKDKSKNLVPHYSYRIIQPIIVHPSPLPHTPPVVFRSPLLQRPIPPLPAPNPLNPFGVHLLCEPLVALLLYLRLPALLEHTVALLPCGLLLLLHLLFAQLCRSQRLTLLQPGFPGQAGACFGAKSSFGRFPRFA